MQPSQIASFVTSYTLSRKNAPLGILSISLSNINRFSRFFRWHTPCSKLWMRQWKTCENRFIFGNIPSGAFSETLCICAWPSEFIGHDVDYEAGPDLAGVRPGAYGLWSSNLVVTEFCLSNIVLFTSLAFMVFALHNFNRYCCFRCLEVFGLFYVSRF